MPWNTKKHLTPKPRQNPLILWVSVGSVIAFVAYLLVCWMSNESASDDGKELVKKSKSKLVRSVKPAKAHELAIKSEKPRKPKHEGVHTNKYGYVMNLPSTAVVITNKVDDADKSIEERIFKSSVNQKIAGLLLMEPGDLLIGDASTLFNENFNRSFKRSLKKPIEILPDDDQFTVELKKAVIETRSELESRMRSGEDVGALLLAERNRLQELGLFKTELSEEIEKIARSKDLTEQELNDFVTAANQMLESRGSTPLTMPRFAVRRFLLQRERTNER